MIPFGEVASTAVVGAADSTKRVLSMLTGVLGVAARTGRRSARTEPPLRAARAGDGHPTRATVRGQ